VREHVRERIQRAETATARVWWQEVAGVVTQTAVRG